MDSLTGLFRGKRHDKEGSLLAAAAAFPPSHSSSLDSSRACMFPLARDDGRKRKVRCLAPFSAKEPRGSRAAEPDPIVTGVE